MYKINTHTNNKTNNNNNNSHIKDKFENCILDTYAYKQNNIINEDIKKLHKLSLHCSMIPKSYTNVLNEHSELKSITPYKIENVKHPKDGYKYKIEYVDFNNELKKDALHFTDKNYKFLDENDKYNQKQTLNNDQLRLYGESKKTYDFAKPMLMTGSNKIADLYDNCMNKKTFEYKRFSNITPHHKQWIENPVFNSDISQDTIILKNKFIDNTETNTMDIYSDVFKDMYAMTYNPIEYTQSALIKKINDELKAEMTT